MRDPGSGIYVVRDDLFPGGTKVRYFAALFARYDHVVYATPVEGGAQTALAHAAAAAGKRVTIVVANRAEEHPRVTMATRLGAEYVRVTPGYLSRVQKVAREVAESAGAYLLPFGAAGTEAEEMIAAAARAIGFVPDEVWSAAGSGMLTRSLAKAWPDADRHAVRVGRELSDADVAGAKVWDARVPFGARAKEQPPFPSDPHYDAKAWSFARTFARAATAGRRVLFWNVTGPAA